MLGQRHSLVKVILWHFLSLRALDILRPFKIWIYIYRSKTFSGFGFETAVQCCVNNNDPFQNAKSQLAKRPRKDLKSKKYSVKEKG